MDSRRARPGQPFVGRARRTNGSRMESVPGGVVRVAAVGCGEQMTSNLLPALRNVPGARLVGAYDVVTTRALQVAAQVGGTVAVYPNLDAVLDDPAVDALVVAAPPAVHLAVASRAIERGVHVFVEKPPAPSTAELRRLARHARDQRVTTATGLNFRHAEPVAMLRGLMRRRWFGEPLLMDVVCTAAKPRQPMWGMSLLRSFLFAQAIHPLDLLISSLGRVSTVRSHAMQRRDGLLLLDVRLGFESGAVGRLLTGNNTPAFAFDVQVFGANGTVAWLDGLHRLTYARPGGRRTEHPGSPKQWEQHWQPRVLDVGYARAGYQRELQEFIDAAAAGRETGTSFGALVHLYETMDAIEREALDAAEGLINSDALRRHLSEADRLLKLSETLAAFGADPQPAAAGRSE